MTNQDIQRLLENLSTEKGNSPKEIAAITAAANQLIKDQAGRCAACLNWVEISDISGLLTASNPSQEIDEASYLCLSCVKKAQKSPEQKAKMEETIKSYLTTTKAEEPF